MSASRTAGADRSGFSIRRKMLPLMALTGSLAVGYMLFGLGGPAAPLTTVEAATLPGMASLSGTVESAKPFNAAQVYIRNADKRILYMVYTNAGKFRAVQLFPGNYEIAVSAKGLISDVQKLTVKAGDSPTLKVTLKDVSAGSLGMDVHTLSRSADDDVPANATFASYDEIYQPGVGRDIIERTCMICHGEDFLPSQPAGADAWNTRIDRMMGRELFDRPARSYAEGLMSFRAQWLRFSRQDREDLVAYLVKNFGPGVKPRRVRTDRETPLDEAKLGKAMFIEYYIPEDPPGKGVNDPQYKAVPGATGRRRGQDVRFDADGNVWESDRGVPRRLIKLDPRTGEFKEWVSPNPTSDVHEVLVGRDGTIWMPEHAEQPGARNYLLGFNPKTEKWDYRIDMDPDDVVRNTIKWGQSVAMDSKSNMYIGWIMGGALTKVDGATRKVAGVYPFPSTNAIPYGTIADRNDNIWVALWGRGSVAKFDTHQNTFTEYSPPTYPGQVRRLNVDYQNNIWFGIWAAGSKRAGKLAKLEQATGKWTEYVIPEQNAQPYDVSPDQQGNIWFPDSASSDRSAAIGMLNTKDGSFTFYPKPQFYADTPKIQVTRDGAVWYAPRGSRRAPAIAVLYPDMDKITTLGAYYLNGPPGYPFKTAVSTAQAAKPSTAGKGQ